MKIKIPCDEANHICDKSQYREATFWEKLRLNIHLLHCKACRKYTAQNQRLTQTIQDAHLKSLPDKEKELLKERLHQELNK